MNKLKGSLAYLAGAIDCMADGGTGWRNDITPWLKDKGIGVLNPCSKPTPAATEDAIMRDRVSKLKAEGRFKEVKEIVKEVVYYDLRMVDKCDFMILNIEPDVHMCGSYHESCYGILQHKPLLILCRKGIQRIPNWMFGIIDIETMFDSVDGICSYLDGINDGIVIPSYKKWKFFDFSKVFD